MTRKAKTVLIAATLFALVIVAVFGYWFGPSIVGRVQAAIDIQRGEPRYLLYGEFAPLEKEVCQALKKKHGITVERVAGCLVTHPLVSHSDAYNSQISRHFGYRDVFVDTVNELLVTSRSNTVADSKAADLARTRAAVSFRSKNSPDMTGFNKHWTLGSRSAWYNMSTGEVLVVGPKKNEAIRISGFPKEYGSVIATGWEDGKRFFVHVATGFDSGTMIYCDLKKREVTKVEHWAAW